MDWERLIPCHPAPGGRLVTKQDVQNLFSFLQGAPAAVKVAAREGKGCKTVEEMTLPKYEDWAGYAQGLPFVLWGYCGPWGRGTGAAAPGVTVGTRLRRSSPARDAGWTPAGGRAYQRSEVYALIRR